MTQPRIVCTACGSAEKVSLCRLLGCYLCALCEAAMSQHLGG
jgi:hypothetical protein